MQYRQHQCRRVVQRPSSVCKSISMVLANILHLFDLVNVAWNISPPRYWTVFINLWHDCDVPMSLSKLGTMIAPKFLLGIAEAAFGAGVLMYLSFFYFRHELGNRIGKSLLNGVLTPVSSWTKNLTRGLKRSE